MRSWLPKPGSSRTQNINLDAFRHAFFQFVEFDAEFINQSSFDYVGEIYDIHDASNLTVITWHLFGIKIDLYSRISSLISLARLKKFNPSIRKRFCRKDIKKAIKYL